MAETTWTEEGVTGAPKKKIPTWAWFCGGGCLLAVLIGAVVLGLGFKYLKKAMDPEVQWERVAKILPYDERPKEMQLVFGNQIGSEQYTFEDSRGFQVQIQNHEGRNGTQAREQMFKEDPEFPENLVVMKFQDVMPGTVRVQGRDLHLLRMRMEFTGIVGKMMPAEARDQLGHLVFIDVTPEGREGMLLMQITRTRGSQTPVTDEEIQTILKPFHVGPDR